MKVFYLFIVKFNFIKKQSLKRLEKGLIKESKSHKKGLKKVSEKIFFCYFFLKGKKLGKTKQKERD